MPVGKRSALVRFSVLALLILGLVGGASAQEYRIIDELGDGTIDGSEVIGGDGTGDNIYHYSQEFCPNQDFEAQAITIYDVTSSDDIGSFSFDVYVNQGVTDKDWDEGSQLVNSKSWSTGDLTASFSSNYQFNSGNCYEVEINTEQTDNDAAFDQIDTGFDSSPTSDKANYERLPSGFSSGFIQHYIDIGFQLANENPQFNSSSITPDPPLIGESVSYSAEVFDSDGSVSYTNLTLEYGGSTVLSDEQRSGTTSPVWNDVFTPQTGNKWLNATLTTVDDKGAATKEEINRYLEDSSPIISLDSPQGKTFDYDTTYTVSTSDDNDNVPSETIECSIDRNTTNIGTITVTEGGTDSISYRSNIGNYEAIASCTEQDGDSNTASDSKDFSINLFEIQSTSSDADVYETENTSYTTSLKVGDMVNSFSSDLYYDGRVADSGQKTHDGTIKTYTEYLYHEPLLVSNNNTAKNWKTEIEVNKTDFEFEPAFSPGSSYSTVARNSSTNTQDVWWAYYIENADTDPADGKYIEAEDFNYNVTLAKKTDKASISGTTTYYRDGSTASMSEIANDSDSKTLQASLDVGLADSFNQSSFNTNADIDLEYETSSRTIESANDTVEVYRIGLYKNDPAGLDTAKTLVFDTDYEEEGYNVETDLDMDLSLWKNRQEQIRRFSYQTTGQEHEFFIYPAWAEYEARTLPYEGETKFDLIQYEPTYDTGNLRSYFFPQPQTLNNQTTTVPLLTINNSETTRIDFEVSNSGGGPSKNTYCRVDRKFPGTGQHKTVFMIKTGGEGKSQSFAEVNEIYYSFTCFKDGEIIEKFPSQIMQNPMILAIGQQEVQTSLDYNDEFDASCNYNKTTIDCEYQSGSESLEKAVLEVDRKEIVVNENFCKKNASTITGGLTCGGLNTSKDNYEYRLYGEYPGDVEIPGAAGQTGETDQSYGAAGILITLLIFLFAFAATAFNVPLGIAVGTISLILSSVANFWVLTPTMRATLIAIAIISGLVAKK